MGISDFKTIRNNEMHYVDKTASIARLIRDVMNGHHLVTAPHGFGKSLMMSTVDAFLNIDYDDDIWFRGRDISGERDMEVHRNAHPVISMDFGRVDPEDIQGSTYALVSKLFHEHGHILGSDDVDGYLEEHYGRSAPEKALADLCRMMGEHHGSRVFVLIDAYDHPVIDAVDEETCRRNSSFINRMLHAIMDSDPPVYLLLSGIVRIEGDALDGFSVQYLHEPLDSRNLGFTDEEVSELMEDDWYPGGFETIVEWYGGYRCGDLHMYNPSSVMQHIDRMYEIRRYRDPDGNDPILRTFVTEWIHDILDDDRSDLESLLLGRWIDAYADLGSAHRAPGVQRDIISAMILNGYLAATTGDGLPPGHFHVRIPNREVYDLFSGEIERILDDPESCIPSLKGLANDFLSRDLIEYIEGDPPPIGPMIEKLVSSRLFEDVDNARLFILYLNSLLGGRFVAAKEATGDGRPSEIVIRSSADGKEELRFALMDGDV